MEQVANQNSIKKGVMQMAKKLFVCKADYRYAPYRSHFYFLMMASAVMR